jgi:hypothetical protein
VRTFRRIVFFWVGQNTLVPTLLVRSIRSSLGPEMEITQLSDRETPEVPGVSTYKSMKLSSRLMVARLEAYASLAIKGPTLFLDADMLVIRDFDLPALGVNEVGVTRRYDRSEINWHAPVDFPEFEGKYFIDEMPYVYSFVYTSSEILFVRQLNRLRKLPKRFHEWYGDQVTLKSELDSGRYVRRDFSIDTYNHTIRSRGEFEDVLANQPDVCLVHFKGAHGKNAIAEVMNDIQGTR